MGTQLDIYLLIADANRRLFYSEVEELPDTGAVPSSGLRAWLEAKYYRFKSRLRHSEGSAARYTRRVWQWLHDRTNPDEVLCSRLRLARSITLSYPEVFTFKDVSDEWAAFLSAGRRRHWPWFLLNLLIAPVSVLLAPLPGPNLLGYWFAYRAVHHLFILRGLGRVRRGEVAVTFRPVGALDVPLSLDPDPDVTLVRFAALGCDPAELAHFLKRQKVWRRSPAAAPVGLDASKSPRDGG